MLAALLTSALANDCAGKSCGDCTTAARGINKCVFRADTNECLTGMDAFQVWGADTKLLEHMKFENAQCARSGREQFLRGVIDMRLARSADADCQAAGENDCEGCIAAGCTYNDNGACKTMASAMMDFHGKADISHFAFSQCPASGKRSLGDDSTELQARGVAFLNAMARSGCTGKPCGECAGDSNCAFYKGANGGCMPRMSAMQMYWTAKDGEMKDMANYALHSGECSRRSVADDIQRFSRLLMERDTQPNKRNKPEWVGEKCESDDDCPSNWWCGSYSLGFFMRDFYCLEARRGVEERSLGVEGRDAADDYRSCMLKCFSDHGHKGDAFGVCGTECGSNPARSVDDNQFARLFSARDADPEHAACMMTCWANNNNNPDAFGLCEKECPATRSVPMMRSGDAGGEDCPFIAEYGMCDMKINFGACTGDLAMGSDCCAASCAKDLGNEQDCKDIAEYGMCDMTINFGTCTGDLAKGSDCCAASCRSARNVDDDLGQFARLLLARGVSAERTSCMLGCFADNGNNPNAYDLCQAKCPATRSVARGIRQERRYETSNWCASRCKSATDSPFGCDCSECAPGGRQNVAGRCTKMA